MQYARAGINAGLSVCTGFNAQLTTHINDGASLQTDPSLYTREFRSD
jgi:hypothetical protein